MDKESVVYEILREIAAADGVEPSDLDFLLQEYIDVDALQKLVDHSGSVWTLSFEVPGHTVTVTSDEVILIDPDEEDD